MRLFSLIAIVLLILVLIPGLSLSEEKLTELEKKELQELEAEQKKYEEYAINGQYHKVQGPARVAWDKSGRKTWEEYYLHGGLLDLKKFRDYR